MFRFLKSNLKTEKRCQLWQKKEDLKKKQKWSKKELNQEKLLFKFMMLRLKGIQKEFKRLRSIIKIK